MQTATVRESSQRRRIAMARGASAVALVDGGGRGPLFDREALAQYLRLSTYTVDRLVKAGKLPCVRIGHQVRFTREDVEAFIERHRRLGGVPLFRGHLTGGPSGLPVRMSVDAKDTAVLAGVPR
jgi:excisionase family DNA binding protein